MTLILMNYLFIFVLANLLHANEMGPRQLTLDEAINIAIQSATSIQKNQGEVELAGEQLLQAYAQFLPNLSIQVGSSQAQGSNYQAMAIPWVNTAGVNYQVTSSINLFNGLSDSSNLESALAKKSSSELSLKRAKQLIALDVTQSFLQVLLNRQIVKIAKDNLNLSRARQELLEARTKVGLHRQADLYRQQAQTSSDELFLLNAENKMKVDELLLLRKLRLDVAKNYQYAEVPLTENTATIKDLNVNDLIRTAIAQRADLQALTKSVDVANWNLKSAKAGYMPKLDFLLAMGVNDRLSDQGSYSLGLTLTWNIFDRKLTQLNIKKTMIQLRNIRLDTEDRKNQIISEVRQSYVDLQAALQKIEASQKGLIAAQKAYDVVKGLYSTGSADFIDLSMARSVLVQAQAARVQASSNYILQLRSLDTAVGKVAYD